MRLAQLARQLGITQSDITSALTKHGFEEKTHGNSKLEHEEIDVLYKLFNYQQEINEQKESDTSPEANTDASWEKALTSIDSKEEPKANDRSDEIDKDERKDEENNQENSKPTEIIRAKKVKLEGIKVVGKIDLPEPKEKETKEEKSVAEKPQRDRSRKSNFKKGSKNRGRRKLSYEEKLKKEAKRIEREKEARKKKIKDKKKKHYFENVQPKSKPVKSKKKAKKKHIVRTFQKKEKPQYKNPIRKFWAWLNGEYDRF